MAEFIFVRHGKSQAQLQKIVGTNAPLAPEGEQQARDTAQKVRQLGITKILYSPLVRAEQTAKIIASELGLNPDQLQSIAGLRERDLGEIEGKPKTHESEWYFTVDNEYGVESRQELLSRMSSCLEKIKQIVEQGETVLVVGHAASGFYLQQVAKGNLSPDELDPITELSNADFVKVQLT